MTRAASQLNGAGGIRRLLAGGVTAAVAMSALAGCGSSSTAKASNTDSASTGTGTGASKTTGDPILIGTVAPIGTPVVDYSGIVSALEAAARTINAEGGVNGRPLKVWSCNEGTTPDQTLACARKAVAAKVTAIIGDTVSVVGGQYEDILAKGNVVDLGATGLIPEAYSAPNSYPISWEAGSWLPCVGKAMVAATGAKKAIYVSNAGDAADSVVEPSVENTAKANGLTWLGSVKVPVSVSDWAPYVAQAQAKGADIVVPVAIGAGPQAFVRAASAAGANFTICAALGLTGQGGWSGVGSAEKNVYVGATFAPLDGTTAMSKRLQKSFDDQRATGDKFADVSPQKILAGAVVAWLGVDTFAQVARTVPGTVDAASFMKKLPSSKVTFDGFFPDVDFSRSTSGGFYQRVFNSGAYLWKWSPSGSYSQVGTAADTLATAVAGK